MVGPTVSIQEKRDRFVLSRRGPKPPGLVAHPVVVPLAGFEIAEEDFMPATDGTGGPMAELGRLSILHDSLDLACGSPTDDDRIRGDGLEIGSPSNEPVLQ